MKVMEFFKPGDVLEIRGKKFIAIERTHAVHCLSCSEYETDCKYIGCDEPNGKVYFVEVEDEK